MKTCWNCRHWICREPKKLLGWCEAGNSVYIKKKYSEDDSENYYEEIDIEDHVYKSKDIIPVLKTNSWHYCKNFQWTYDECENDFSYAKLLLVIIMTMALTGFSIGIIRMFFVGFNISELMWFFLLPVYLFSIGITLAIACVTGGFAIFYIIALLFKDVIWPSVYECWLQPVKQCKKYGWSDYFRMAWTTVIFFILFCFLIYSIYSGIIRIFGSPD